MLVLIPRLLKQLKRIYRRNSQRISRFAMPIKFFLIAILLVLVSTFYVQGDKPNYEAKNTAVRLDPNSLQILVLAEKQVKVERSVSRADVAEGLDNMDREILMAYMQDLGNQYEVDWKLVYAIGYLESGNYNSSLARNQYNFFGRKARSGVYASWSSPEEAIRNQFEYLKTRYLERGMDTPWEMNRVYAESGTWASKVVSIMNSL